MDEVAAKLQADHRPSTGPRSVALYNGTKSWSNVSFEHGAELADGHRLAVLLHHGHRRPAGEEHGRRAARLLAGRPPPHRGLRRRPVRRHEPAPVVPGRGREAPLPERAHVPPAVRAAGARRHRDRPAAHRDRPPRGDAPGGEAGRGSDAAGGDGAADPRRGPLRPRLRRRERGAARAAAPAAVEPFTLEYVARRTGVAAADVAAAARRFARGPRGAAVAGTGPNMAPHPLATEMLVCVLNTLCGRYGRAGRRGEPRRGARHRLPAPRGRVAAPRVLGLPRTTAGARPAHPQLGAAVRRRWPTRS